MTWGQETHNHWPCPQQWHGDRKQTIIRLGLNNEHGDKKQIINDIQDNNWDKSEAICWWCLCVIHWNFQEGLRPLSHFKDHLCKELRAGTKLNDYRFGRRAYMSFLAEQLVDQLPSRLFIMLLATRAWLSLGTLFTESDKTPACGYVGLLRTQCNSCWCFGMLSWQWCTTLVKN
jgi:hypothetical protein